MGTPKVGVFGWGIVAPKSPDIEAFEKNLESAETWLTPFNGFGPDNFLAGTPEFDFTDYRDWINERFAPRHYQNLAEKMDLPALYAGAAVYVTPSLEEGFGSTVLEAMACGAPVAVSNRAALPEVVADAGLLFDAEHEADIVATLARVLSDAALADDLRRRALARAGLYTLARTTGRVLALLRETTGDRS